MKTLLTVMAHADAQHIFDRHFQYWNTGDHHVMVMCPQDSMVRSFVPVLGIGTKCHHGPASIARFRRLLHFLCETDYDWFIIHEYDSIELPTRNGVLHYADPDKHWHRIYSNLFTADQPQFKGHHFLHPPLSMSKGVLKRIAQEGCHVGDDAEQSFWDRWLGLVCEQAGVEMKGYDDNGFSRNTIEQHDIPAAVAARRAGATMFHGVKSGEVLRQLVEA